MSRIGINRKAKKEFMKLVKHHEKHGAVADMMAISYFLTFNGIKFTEKQSESTLLASTKEKRESAVV